MKYWLSLFITISSLVTHAQLKPIGSWTDHLPYQSGTSITTNGEEIFVGTRTGFYSYNSNDGSISRYSKINLLNDVVVSKIKYNEYNNTIIVVYDNANIDLIRNNTITNIPFIKNSEAVTNKTINEISFENEIAYLSFGFGIAVINTDKNEISNTFRFGSNGGDLKVNSTAILNQNIYASTDLGLYKANLNDNLLDYNSWGKLATKSQSVIKKLFTNQGSLYAFISENNKDYCYKLVSNQLTIFNGIHTDELISFTKSNSEYTYLSKDKIIKYDQNFNELLNFDQNNDGSVEATSNGSYIYVANTFDPLRQYDYSQNINVYKPNGPFSSRTTSIKINNGILWATNSRFDKTYNSSFINAAIYKLENGTWSSYLNYSTPGLNGAFDIMSVAFHPENESVYFGSFGTALYKADKNLNFTKIDSSNSIISPRQDTDWDWTGVPSVVFDESNNMWATNTYTENPLLVKIGNDWTNFKLSKEVSSSIAVTEIVISDGGYKWVAIPRNNAICVFDDNGTITNKNDDRTLFLSSEEGKGGLPGIVGITMAKDKKGQIWVGTSDGIVVFYNPDQVFDATNPDAQRILIEGPENVEVLLESTTIHDIEVDGANRKWIATEESGVYLFSEDGTELIHHFTEENSPLISNNVTAIGIDNQSGEVYFGTSNGILSYRGTATEGLEDFSKVKVFPNPVKDDYSGPISISGLMDNSTVKITDISGNLVNELRSVGGQAIWDGNTFNGTRANTGVYLIFNSAENEEESLKTNVGKILFIN